LVAEIGIWVHTQAKKMPILSFFPQFIKAGKDVAIEEVVDVSSWHFNRAL